MGPVYAFVALFISHERGLVYAFVELFISHELGCVERFSAVIHSAFLSPSFILSAAPFNNTHSLSRRAMHQLLVHTGIVVFTSDRKTKVLYSKLVQSLHHD